MYADDGIILRKRKNLALRDIMFTKYFSDSGVRFAMDKTREVTDTLKFLGAELDIKSRQLRTTEGT